MLDPKGGSPATGRSVAGLIYLFVDVRWNSVAKLDSKKDFSVGSEDWNDMLFTGQTIRWMKDPQSRPCIEVSQEKATEELGEIHVERNTKEDLHCTPAMHTMYRSLLGQINWLQNRTQFQCCYKFFQMCFSGTFSNNW